MDQTAKGYFMRYRDAWHAWRRRKGEYGTLLAFYDEDGKKCRIEAIRAAELKANEVKGEILAFTDCLTDLQAEVIRKRYLELTPEGRLKSWKDISSEMGYSEQHIFREHKKALEALSKLRGSGNVRQMCVKA